jgi:hypothetical protein
MHLVFYAKKGSQVGIFRGCAFFSSGSFRLGRRFGSVFSVVIRSKAYTGLIGFFSAQSPLLGRFNVRPCFYPKSRGDAAYVSLSILENYPDLGRAYRPVRTTQCLPLCRVLAMRAACAHATHMGTPEAFGAWKFTMWNAMVFE